MPDHAKSHFELGLLYLGPLGDPEAIRAEPDHSRAAEARRLLAASGREVG